MRLPQRGAADKLGLKKRVIQYYEHGKRDGEKIEIPRAVELACYALMRGIETYDGTIAKKPTRKRRPPRKKPGGSG
jgi:hypothetical protein